MGRFADDSLFPSGVKIYMVGGAVRDALMGIANQDHDYVVVGATFELMRSLGFEQVGRDFPVFLHPITKDEYALARTERKTAPGYRGFQIDAASTVTLEEDLMRRDLSINAIAQDQDGNYIDPFGGRDDISHKIFRHVSAAFQEDPVRILRVARFSARWPDFSIAPETLSLMTAMVNAGEVDALVPERIWQELEKTLLTSHPNHFLRVLDACGAFVKIFPEFAAIFVHHQHLSDVHDQVQNQVRVQLQDCAKILPSVVDNLRITLAMYCKNLDVIFDGFQDGDAVDKWVVLLHIWLEVANLETVQYRFKELCVPHEFSDACGLYCKLYQSLKAVITDDLPVSAELCLTIFNESDYHRRPNRLLRILKIFKCLTKMDMKGHTQFTHKLDVIQKAVNAESAVLGREIAVQYKTQPQLIPSALSQARLQAIECVLNSCSLK